MIKHNIYINIDGFAKYYFDMLIKNEKETPFLKRIIKNGVFFNNLKNALPSITNPCQNMILSGSTSKITKNVYRYFDVKENKVIQQHRENATKLISEIAISNNKSVISIAHFLTEKDLTSDNPKRLYIKNNNFKYYNYLERFNQLIKLINDNKAIVNDKEIIIDEFPNLLILYIDDLDGLGHNFVSTYGSKVATSEEERLNNVLNTLKLIDKKIEEMTNALKKKGLYDKTRIFITTDHGMTPYGGDVLNKPSKYQKTKINELINKLKEYNSNFKIEFLGPNEVPKDDTNLIMVGANLNIQLKFLNKISNKELEKIKNYLINEYYIEKIKTRKQLKQEKYWTYAADLFISPKERYYFGKDISKDVFVKGQHDSMNKTSNEIVGWIFGGDTKEIGYYNQLAYNYDFGVTMAKSLKVKLPNYNGKVLNVFKNKL